MPIYENGEKLVYKGKNPWTSSSDNKESLISRISEHAKAVIDAYSNTYEGDMTRKMLTDYNSEAQFFMMIDTSGRQRVFLPAESV